MKYDIIVLGSGPAGLSAAVTARGRNKSVLVIGNRWQDSPLARAERVDNYLGMPGMTGMEMLEAFQRHAQEMGVEMVTGKVLSIMEWEGFHLTVGSQLYQGSALILAPGVVRQTKFPGEETYLGRGVSYCATCDGMLYRGRDVVVAGFSAEAPEEANYLHELGCRVTYVSRRAPEGLSPEIPVVTASRLEIVGEGAVTALRADGKELPCACVFLLRPSVAPAELLPGLELEGGYIRVDRDMAAGIPGVFAAGDCTGLPLQVSKAVGEGLVAGQRAAEYVDRKAGRRG